MPVAPPDDVKQLLTSIFLDFGEIPPEYLVPAGDGEYDPSLVEDRPADPDAVARLTDFVDQLADEPDDDGSSGAI